MNTIDNKVLESLNLSSQQTNQQNKKDSLGQSEFLKLMTAQLNNQDPTKPLEGGQFFSQIAQFSTVAGIQDLQDSFKQVASAMYSSQVLQASAMVGRSVLTPSSQVTAGAGEGIKGLIALPASTNRLVVSVLDSRGQLVKRLDMGQQRSGDVPFSWDGRDEAGTAVPGGIYQFKAEAQTGQGVSALQTFVAAKVQSVSVGSGGQGVTLNLEGQNPMDLANVKQVM